MILHHLAVGSNVNVKQDNQNPQYPSSVQEAELLINSVRAQRDILKAELIVEEKRMTHNKARANYHLLQCRKAAQRAQNVKGKLVVANQVVGRARMVISDGGYVSTLSIPFSPHPKNVRRVPSKSTNTLIYCIPRFVDLCCSGRQLTVFL